MKAAIIGAGLGGLSAAVELAASGASVTVFEASSGPGGKAGTVVIDGVEVDTGPSVLTMPDVLEKILARGGRDMAEEAGGKGVVEEGDPCVEDDIDQVVAQGLELV